jgi:antitoxin component of MazEF toxin-antitoxin module
MAVVKARIQGNATVITLPSELEIPVGERFTVSKDEQGNVIFKPYVTTPQTAEELFAGWNGVIEQSEEQAAWENMKPEGDEIW